MFDPTTRLQSARMHSHDLHHAARHSTHHAADHALQRAAARGAARSSARSSAPGGARSPGCLSSLLTALGSRSRRPVRRGPSTIAAAACGVPLDHQST
ncbi:MAG: hypothetical protein ACXWCB_00965 [Acidimicrobiales bacterium]